MYICSDWHFAMDFVFSLSFFLSLFFDVDFVAARCELDLCHQRAGQHADLGPDRGKSDLSSYSRAIAHVCLTKGTFLFLAMHYCWLRKGCGQVPVRAANLYRPGSVGWVGGGGGDSNGKSDVSAVRGMCACQV